MNTFKILIEEHDNIKRMLSVSRKYCNKMLNGEVVDYDVFLEIIDFIRNYADKHHHGKEEQFLFNKMIEECNIAIQKTIQNGMLVEHDMGRCYVQGIEKAVNKVKDGDLEARLDIIGNAIAYNDLLQRHIDKEDNILYKYAQINLSEKTLDELEKQSIEFEDNAEIQGIQEKYLNLLDTLENKVAQMK